MKTTRTILMLLTLLAGSGMAHAATAYETKLSQEFWYNLRNDKVDDMRKWTSKTKGYLLLGGAFSPNRNHFYKKLGMAGIMFSSINGGSNDFRLSTAPYIADTLTFATLAHKTAAPGDGFSQRMYLTYNFLVMSVLFNDKAGVMKAIDDIVAEANKPQYSPVQKPVFYEVLATLLLTAKDPALVQIGVDYFEQSLALIRNCTSQDCVDAATLAPFYEVVNLISIGEGYAMLNLPMQSTAYLNEAVALATEKNWPYLNQFLAYRQGITAKFSTATQVTNPWPTGFKKEQPFLFNHENGCRYCHVTQTVIPTRYLPK